MLYLLFLQYCAILLVTSPSSHKKPESPLAETILFISTLLMEALLATRIEPASTVYKFNCVMQTVQCFHTSV